MDSITDKFSRLLFLQEKLFQGKVIKKSEMSSLFGVTEKTIERDIKTLNIFLDTRFKDSSESSYILFDRKLKGYRFEEIETKKRKGLLDKEVYLICKILMDSRAFRKEDIIPIINSLIENCVDQENIKHLKNLLNSEMLQYAPVKHGTEVFNKVWDLSFAINKHLKVEINYKRMKSTEPTLYIIEPIWVVFSQFYFYILAYISGKEKLYPTTFRIDRISDYKLTENKFYFSYKNRTGYSEVEYKKRAPFMYAGEILTIKFQYNGDSVEAILDSLPTSKILNVENEVFTIEAEIFREGVKKWLLSQMDKVTILHPESFRCEMIELVDRIKKNYEDGILNGK